MEYNEIYQLVSVTSTDIANKFLEHGWKVIHISNSSSADDRYLSQGVFQDSVLVIVLGATKAIADSYPASKANER